MKKLKIFFCICLIIISALMLSSCSGKGDIADSNITSVELKGSGDKMEVKIQASFTEDFVEEHKGEKIYLIAKDMTSSAESYTPLAETRVKSSIKFEIPFEENGKNHLNTAFVCAIIEGEGDARQFTPVTDERYIQNISKLGGGASRPSASTIKGLATDNIGHASYLGVDHLLLEVRIDKILLEGYEDGAVCLVDQGLTYYFDGEQIEYFDKTISEATASGVRVYLQFVLGTPDKKDEKQPIDCLYFPAASSKATYYMPNLSEKATEGYLSALYSLFADRYSGEHGVAIDYIIGKNVNVGGTWNNSGSCDAPEEYYLAWVRLAHNCLVSTVSNGRVYISLDNGWRAQSGGALAYLNSFNTSAKATGNFDYGIALSYGEISGDSVWASSDEHSTSLTPDSLSELGVILGTDDFKFEDNQRSVIISDFALKNNKNSENNSTRRAASYAYTYYATQKYDFIDALIYSSYESDTWGLLTSSGESTSLCDVFEICGSNRVGELSYMDSLVGNKWTALKSEDGFNNVSVYYGAPTQNIKTSGAKRLFNFGLGKNYGFVPMGDAYYASLCEYSNTDGKTGTYLLCNGGNENWRVFYSGDVQKSEIPSSKYIGITLNTESSGEEFVIIITGTSKKTKQQITYCAKAQATSSPTEYFFDISSFSDKLMSSSDISFAICTPTSESQYAGGLSVYKVALYGSSGTQVWKYILIAAIIIVLAVALFIVIRIVNNMDKKKKRSSRKKTSGSVKKHSDSPKIQGTDEFDDEEFELETEDGEE